LTGILLGLGQKPTALDGMIWQAVPIQAPMGEL
jgi:hypothetical protein